MLKTVLVGCCGFPVARSKYYKIFRVVEVQQTFYKLPSEDTAKKWRSEAPTNFIFTMKAWQAITHGPKSPTWRKAGLKIDPSKADRYGHLKPTRENLEAWEKTKRIAEILEARVIVFQTPPSFGYTEENLKNAIEFFRTINDSKFIIAWEPRGTWNQHYEAIRKVVEEANVIHVVDPLRRDPVKYGQVVYYRLHGLGGREVNYRYKYSDEDLSKLTDIVKSLPAGVETVYILFNNVYMFDDAQRFKNMCRERCNANVP